MLSYCKHGLLAGMAGGGAMALFLLAIGERSIRDALEIEVQRSAGEDGVEMFSRGTQLAGGSLALLLYGAMVGVIFGVVFAAIRHRSRLRSDFERAIGLATVGFATIVLIPALKYPANPPAVGNHDTVDQRTAAYLTLVALSVIASFAAWRVSRWLRARGVADHLRVPAVAVGYLAAIAAAYVVWPGNPDEIGVPATLIWRFRIAAVGGAATLWAVLGVTFGWLCLWRVESAVSVDADVDARPMMRA